jgi:hypothetical protein
MTAIEKLLAVASAEIGYLEKASNKNLYDKTANAGNANYTKYGYEMHKLYPTTMDFPAAWCDCFVDWCFVQAFGSEIAAKMLYRFDDYTINSSGYFKNNKRWYKSPIAGDQIFFTDSKGIICHTGLVYSVDKNTVYTIEGNTSSASGVVANGGCVRKKSYSLSYNKIAGYGRPDYSLVEDMYKFTETPVALNGVVTASRLNIREMPSTNSSIIGEHVAGDTMIISAKTDNGWYRVDYPHIGTGYLYAEHVDVSDIVVEEYTEVNDIVKDLYNRGIVTDIYGMIEEMNLNPNGRLYWLARKAVHYMRNND